jgi:hypothetical protein
VPEENAAAATAGIWPPVPGLGWTEMQVRAFRLLVNRSATWAAWDDDLLAAELKALIDADVHWEPRLTMVETFRPLASPKV